MIVMMHLGLEHVFEAGDVDRGRDYKASRSLAERLGRVRETKTWKQHSNQYYSNHFEPLFLTELSTEFTAFLLSQVLVVQSFKPPC